MILQGKNFIGFENSAKGEETFRAFAPVTNDYLQGDFAHGHHGRA